MFKPSDRTHIDLESLESRLLLTGGIAGTVTDVSTHQPIAGLTVQVFQSSNPNSADSNAWDWVTSVQTDSNGQYLVSNLDARDYHLNISDGEQSSVGTYYIQTDLFNVVVFDGATTQNMDFQARPAGHISGHVYGPNNAPLSNVQLLVDAAYTPNDNNTWHQATTDANGRYDLYLAPSDEAIYQVEILDAPAGGTSGGYQTTYAVQIAPGYYSATLVGTVGPDFHLALGGVIHGHVVTADGAPVQNMNGVLEPQTPITNGLFYAPHPSTDSNGDFWIDGVPVGTNIYLRTDEWCWRDFSSNGHYYAWGGQNLGPFTVTAGQLLDIGTLTVPRAGTIRGVVTDANGLPVVGAGVSFKGITDQGGSVSLDHGDGVTTDALGQYRDDYLPQGQYTVMIAKDGWLPYNTTADLTVASDQVLQQDVVLQPASTGVTLNGTITNFTDFATKNQAGQILPNGALDNQYGPVGTVFAYDPSKQWTIRDMLSPDRNFIAMVDTSDGFGDYFQSGSTPAGAFQFALPAGQTLKVQAVAGTWDDGVAWSGLLSDPVTVSGTSGQSLDNFNIAIPEGTATISGAITFPAGYGGVRSDNSIFLMLKPAGAGNSFLGRAVGTPDSNGHYRLVDVPAGSYNLCAFGWGLGEWVSGTITLTAGQSLTQPIAMTHGAVVTGTVTSASAPVAGAAVYSQNTGVSAITDANGVFTLSGLAAGGDTLTASMPGLVGQSVDIVLAANAQQTQNFDLASSPSSITGTVSSAGQAVAGAVVIADNTLTNQQWFTTTVGGQFTFAALPAGQYVLGTHADGMTTVTYPGGSGTITLDPATAWNMSTQTINHIELSPLGPTFSVTSAMSSGQLAITFHSDIPLLALPIAAVVSGNGVLSAVTQVDSTTFTAQYTPAGGESLAQISLAEDPAAPVVSGSPVSETFGFDVAATLVQETGTTFFNAAGASASMSGAQDNSSVYVPPFALAGSDSTSAITLTASRYGDPGAALGNTTAVTGVYDFSFSRDGQSADVQLAHQATVTLAFSPPAGMTAAQFQATLKVGYKNESLNPPQWVWNDMADSDPASGISDIRLNWQSSTITFKAAHFTEFAGALQFDHQLMHLAPRWTFHDADGTAVTVTLAGPGTVDLVRGVDANSPGNLLNVIASQTTSASTLIITTLGGTVAGTTLGGLHVAGPLGGLVALTTDLTGDATIDATLGRMTLRNVVSGSTISIGATPGGTSAATIASTKPALTFGRVQDLTLDSASPILSLRCVDWLETSGPAVGITAPALTTLMVLGRPAVLATSTPAVAGNFEAGLVLSGVAGSALPTITLASISGGVSSADWDVNGRIGTILVKANATGWMLHSTSHQLTGVTFVSAAAMSIADLTVNGKLSRLSAASFASGSISAGTMASLMTRGDFGADLMLAGAAPLASGITPISLASAIIGGRVTGGTWTITGPVSLISAKSTAAATINLLGGSGTLGTLLLTDRTATSSPTISATSIRTASVSGGLANASFTLSQGVSATKQALGLLHVGGGFADSLVNSSGNIGVISLRTLTDSQIFAGVNTGAVPAGLPTAAGQFNGSSISQLPTINSVQILGPVPVVGVPAGPSLVNSSIAAGKITSVMLTGTVADQDDGGGANPTPFGFATWQTITSYHGPAANGDYRVEVI